MSTILKEWALFSLGKKIMVKDLLLKFLFFVSLFLPLTIFSEELPKVREYQVKATFLLNFNKFITYPETAFSGSDHNICILGDDPFQNSFSILVKNEKINGRSIKVGYLWDTKGVSECQALFISQSEQRQLADIISVVKQYPILTVSDIGDFVTRGGMIQFYILDNNVRFFIDPVTASEAGLKISSRLLQIAKVVKK